MINILYWLLYCIINVILAYVNKLIISNTIKNHGTDAIKHGWWTLGYCVLISPFYHHWPLIVSFLVLHLALFSTALNLMRNKPAFELSTTTTAFTDRLQVYLGFKSTRFLYISVLVISVILLFLKVPALF